MGCRFWVLGPHPKPNTHHPTPSGGNRDNDDALDRMNAAMDEFERGLLQSRLFAGSRQQVITYTHDEDCPAFETGGNKGCRCDYTLTVETLDD